MGDIPVAIISDENGDPVWLTTDHIDGHDWTATLAEDRYQLFHELYRLADEILAETIAASPRYPDGSWRQPCDTYQPCHPHGGLPARDWWVITFEDDNRELAHQFDSQAEAEAVLARLRQGGGFVFGYGPGPSYHRPSLAEIPVDDWHIAHRHHDAVPPRTDHCDTCWFPKNAHHHKPEDQP